MKNKKILGLFLLVLFFSSSLSALETKTASAKAVVQKTIDDLVSVVAEYDSKEQRQALRAKMRKVIEPRFDFKEMAKRSLGAQWKKRTDAERKEFVGVFSELLAKTYLNKIENIQSDTVSITGEKLSPPKAVVKTKVDFKGDSFPLDYKLLYRKDQWKVYDVVIENIGLVSNYRNEFAGIIRKKDFSGLVEQLKRKLSGT